MKRIWTLAALILLAHARPAAAQSSTPVGPGSPEIRTAELRAGVDTMELLLLEGGTEFAAGMLVLRTDLASATLTRVERMTGRGGDVLSVDSFTVDRATLAAIAGRVTSGEGARELRFEAGRVRSSGRGAPLDTAVASPVFYGNSVDLVLGALPLREGYEARVHFFEEGGPVRVRVTGAEEVATADGGRCPAWRVEVRGGSHGGTYWIGRGSPSLVRFDTATGGFRVLRRAGCAVAGAETRATRR